MAKKTNLTSLILQQNILSVLLLTLVAIMVWVGFSIYFSFSQSTITPTDNSLIAPLTPKLNTALFTQLAARKSWSDADLNSFQPTIVVTTTGSQTPPPRASVSATVSATPVVSPVSTASGTLTP